MNEIIYSDNYDRGKVDALPAPAPSWRSPEIGALAAALAKAQAVIRDAYRNAENPHFGSDYATLDAVLSTVRPVLAAEGLSLSQLVESDPGAIAVRTMLMHSSGQWISSRASWPVGTNIQQACGVITYLRRYGVAAITGTASDKDDDGNTGTGKDETNGMMTRKQIDDCMDVAHRAFGVQGDELKAKIRDCAKVLGLPSSAECTYQQGELLLAELRKFAKKED